MYLLGKELTIEWDLPTCENPPLLEELRLIFIDPKGFEIFYLNPTIEYRPATETEIGSVMHKFTPQMEGSWTIRLVQGTKHDHVILGKVQAWVFDNCLVTPPFSSAIGTPAPYDLSFYMQGHLVAGETFGAIAVPRDISLSENVPKSSAMVMQEAKDYDVEVEILRNGNYIGAIKFPRLTTVGTITSKPTRLLRGDIISLRVGATSDYNIQDAVITIVGACNIVSCEAL